MAKGSPVTDSNIFTDNNRVKLSADGNVAGIQIDVTGDYTVIQESIPPGWEFHQNENMILMYSLDASPLNSDILFEFDGELEIHSALVADWFGNGISTDLNVIPDGFSLNNAYPNPFNPVTMISYSLPSDALVSLDVYDLAGRKVTELVVPNATQNAGNYSVEFNAVNLSSGIYFVMMRANSVESEFVSRQKLVLLK